MDYIYVMKYRLWKIVTNKIEGFNLVKEESSTLNKEVQSLLENIEEGIIRAASKAQYQKIGFGRIGAEIRSQVEDLFGDLDNGRYLYKATENKRAIPMLVLDWMKIAKEKDLYVFVYDIDFGQKLVDRSTISLNKIDVVLKKYFDLFDLKENVQFHFIEVYGLTRASIVEAQKIKDKTYYKLMEI